VNAPPQKFWAALPLGRGVELLAHDPHGVVALAKPAGTLSHPNEKSDEPRSLLNARYALDDEAYEWTGADGSQRLWLLNRLDSATSGVILATTDGSLAKAIRAEFKRKQVRKIYVALVFGTPPQSSQLWRDLLAVQKQGGKIRTAASAGNIPAESRMSLVRAGRQEPKVSLIKLEPRTGRSHQLRVQCAKRGLPIVGDQTYGNFPRNRDFAKKAGTKRLFLHSLEVSFDYEAGGQKHFFTAKAPLPPEFETWL
jgi:tRNA pseudouridine65 synthase